MLCVIIERMHRQGKKLCINYIAKSLGFELINIMISQSTKEEILLKNKNMKELLNEKILSKVLKKTNLEGKELSLYI